MVKTLQIIIDMTLDLVRSNGQNKNIWGEIECVLFTGLEGTLAPFHQAATLAENQLYFLRLVSILEP